MGAESAIRMYAMQERKLMKEARGVRGGKLERHWLIKPLYKPIDEVKGFRQEQLDKVIEQYPGYSRLLTTYLSYHNHIFHILTKILKIRHTRLYI